jgi:hypothetical protein
MFDNETQAAVFSKWNEAPTITEVVVGGLHESPVNVDGNERPQEPYATLEVKPDGRSNQVSAGGGEIDFRRARITIYGAVQATVATAMKLVNAAFDEKPLTIENAEWMRTEAIPESHGRLEKADKANAQSLWKGTLEYRVWSSRQKATA